MNTIKVLNMNIFYDDNLSFLISLPITVVEKTNVNPHRYTICYEMVLRITGLLSCCKTTRRKRFDEIFEF